jgi:CBS domain-containing protein
VWLLIIGHVMKREVVSIDSEASVRDAANKMTQHGIGSLIVTERRKPVGIITETDVLSRVVALSRDAESTEVKAVMSRPLICGTPDMDFVEAVRLMINRTIKKLPVTHGEQLVGILTMTDVIAVHPVVNDLIEEEARGRVPNRFTKRLRKARFAYPREPHQAITQTVT